MKWEDVAHEMDLLFPNGQTTLEERLAFLQWYRDKLLQFTEYLVRVGVAPAHTYPLVPLTAAFVDDLLLDVRQLQQDYAALLAQVEGA